MAVDFPEVMRNAAAEGIDLQQIAIKYESLSETQLLALQAHQQVTHNMGNGAVLAKFPLEGLPLFQDKAVHVFYLGA